MIIYISVRKMMGVGNLFRKKIKRDNETSIWDTNA